MPAQDPFKVPKAMQPRFDEIVSITDRVCHDHLNDEYAQLCRKTTAALGRKRPSPLDKGNANIWAAGITHAIGRVNFLNDETTQPHMRIGDLAKAFGVSQGTMSNKASEIWKLLDLIEFHPDYSLPSFIDQNPMIWLLDVNGFVVDVRTAPLITQLAAFQQGLIPYVPAFKDQTPEAIAGLLAAELELLAADGDEAGEAGLLEIPPPTAIYQLKITLKYSQPPIWRRVLVPDNFLLGDLHAVIQTVMDWDDEHLHEFEIDKVHYGPVDLELDLDVTDEDEILLASVIRKRGQKFLYTYDFGDSWEHVIAVEKILPVDEQQSYPRCVDGARACPPEDCGGVWGYEHFVEALRDPTHPDHAEMVEWYGDEFDPEAFDLAAIDRALRGEPGQ